MILFGSSINLSTKWIAKCTLKKKYLSQGCSKTMLRPEQVTCICAPAHIHPIHTARHTNACRYTHTNIHNARHNTCTHAHTSAHMHTTTHSYIHTQTHTHTHTHMPSGRLPGRTHTWFHRFAWTSIREADCHRSDSLTTTEQAEMKAMSQAVPDLLPASDEAFRQGYAHASTTHGRTNASSLCCSLSRRQQRVVAAFEPGARVSFVFLRSSNWK